MICLTSHLQIWGSPSIGWDWWRHTTKWETKTPCLCPYRARHLKLLQFTKCHKEQRNDIFLFLRSLRSPSHVYEAVLAPPLQDCLTLAVFVPPGPSLRHLAECPDLSGFPWPNLNDLYKWNPIILSDLCALGGWSPIKKLTSGISVVSATLQLSKNMLHVVLIPLGSWPREEASLGLCPWWFPHFRRDPDGWPQLYCTLADDSVDPPGKVAAHSRP